MRPLVLSSLFFATLCVGALALDVSALPESEVDQDYAPFLSAMSLEVANGGAKLFKLDDGTIWLVSVGATHAGSDSAGDALRRRTVAKVKAQASAAAEIGGTKVEATTVMKTEDTLTVRNGVESGISTETLEETIITKARGVIRGMPIVATWMNQDRTLFYAAIGGRIN